MLPIDRSKACDPGAPGGNGTAMTEDGQAPGAYAQAIALFKQGQLPQAQTLLEQCVKESPTHVGSRFGLAVCYEKSQEPARAEAMYRIVTALDPSHYNATIHLARLLEKQGRVHEALQQFRAAQALRPDDVEPGARAAALTGLAGSAQGVAAQPVSAPAATTGPGSVQVTDPLAPAGAAEGTTLASTLDSPDSQVDAGGMSGAVLHRGHRRLLSHRRFWSGVGILLLVPLLGLLTHLLNDRVLDAGRRPGDRVYDAVRAFDEAVYYLQYVAVALAVACILAAVASAMLTTYIVSERRVEITRGVLFRSNRSVWLYDVNDLIFQQSPLETLVNTGTLTLRVEEAPSRKQRPPALVGFGSARFLRGVSDQLQPLVLRERRSMKKQFV